MPVTKPTVLPRFATAGGASVTEPVEAKKDSGWAVGEAPPAQTFNWLHKHTHSWLEWLQDIANQAFTWSQPQTWSQSGTFTLGALFSGLAQFSDLVRLDRAGGDAVHNAETTVVPVGERRFLFKMRCRASPDVWVRLYLGAAGPEVSVNAAWDHASELLGPPVYQWAIDNVAYPSAFVQLSGSRLVINSRLAADTTNPYPHNSFGAGQLDINNGRITPSVRKVVGAAGQPFYENDYIASAGLTPMGFLRDALGHVWLDGSATGMIDGGVMFTLPVGYRPRNTIYLYSMLTTTSLTSPASAFVRIDADGKVRPTPQIVSFYGAVHLQASFMDPI